MVALNIPHIDEQILTFGKYKGMTPNAVGDVDPHYICWLFENVKPEVLSKELYNACELATQKESGADEGDYVSAYKW